MLSRSHCAVITAHGAPPVFEEDDALFDAACGGGVVRACRTSTECFRALRLWACRALRARTASRQGRQVRVARAVVLADASVSTPAVWSSATATRVVDEEADRALSSTLFSGVRHAEGIAVRRREEVRLRHPRPQSAAAGARPAGIFSCCHVSGDLVTTEPMLRISMLVSRSRP